MFMNVVIVHNGQYVNAAEFKKNFPKNHIPFIRKFG